MLCCAAGAQVLSLASLSSRQHMDTGQPRCFSQLALCDLVRSRHSMPHAAFHVQAAWCLMSSTSMHTGQLKMARVQPLQPLLLRALLVHATITFAWSLLAAVRLGPGQADRAQGAARVSARHSGPVVMLRCSMP